MLLFRMRRRHVLVRLMYYPAGFIMMAIPNALREMRDWSLFRMLIRTCGPRLLYARLQTCLLAMMMPDWFRLVFIEMKLISRRGLLQRRLLRLLLQVVVPVMIYLGCRDFLEQTGVIPAGESFSSADELRAYVRGRMSRS